MDSVQLPQGPHYFEEAVKIQKVQVLLHFGRHNKFFRPPPPPPLAERVGGHCELALL